jgi:hypothetical protein
VKLSFETTIRRRDIPTKKTGQDKPLTGAELIKETCRRIRLARSFWDAHNNRACRGERDKAMALYNRLTQAEREKVPQVLRVWLRYRSEKYFGDDRTRPGGRKPS